MIYRRHLFFCVARFFQTPILNNGMSVKATHSSQPEFMEKSFIHFFGTFSLIYFNSFVYPGDFVKYTLTSMSYREGRFIVSDFPNAEFSLLVGVNSVWFLGRTVTLLEESEVSVTMYSVHDMRHDGKCPPTLILFYITNVLGNMVSHMCQNSLLSMRS